MFTGQSNRADPPDLYARAHSASSLGVLRLPRIDDVEGGETHEDSDRSEPAARGGLGVEGDPGQAPYCGEALWRREGSDVLTNIDTVEGQVPQRW
jgi:hypothetical protein